MLKLKFDLLNFRHIQGRKDPTRHYTIVEGIVTLSSGKRAYCEAFLQDRKSFLHGPHILELEIRTDQNRRITASVVSCYAETKAA